MSKKACALFILVFLAVVLIRVYSISGSLVEDSACDLVDIWTGERVETCIGYVDVLFAELREEEGYLRMTINLSESIPEVVGERLYYYLLFDSDDDSENNCADVPFAQSDTMYVLVYDGAWSLSREEYYSWGWDSSPTEAYFRIGGGGRVLEIIIPLSELPSYNFIEKLPWRIVTEAEYVAGDLAPDAGMALMYKYEKTAEVAVRVPVEVSWISIDGQVYASEGGIEISLPLGEHVISVPEYVNVSEYERLVFVEWSDGVKDNPRKIYIGEGGVELECVYERYLRVDVVSS